MQGIPAALLHSPGLVLNLFICDRPEPREPGRVINKPECLVSRPGMRLWHLHDAEFCVPKGALFIAVDSEHAVHTKNTSLRCA